MQKFGYQLLEEPRPYSEKRLLIKRILLVIVLLLGGVMALWNLLYAVICWGFCMAVITGIPLLENDRFFIKAFYIWENNVVIDYRDKKEYMRLAGQCADFSIRLDSIGGDQAPPVYTMYVYYQGVHVITQHEHNGWREEMFRNLQAQLPNEKGAISPFS